MVRPHSFPSQQSVEPVCSLSDSERRPSAPSAGCVCDLERGNQMAVNDSFGVDVVNRNGRAILFVRGEIDMVSLAEIVEVGSLDHRITATYPREEPGAVRGLG